MTSNPRPMSTPDVATSAGSTSRWRVGPPVFVALVIGVVGLSLEYYFIRTAPSPGPGGDPTPYGALLLAKMGLVAASASFCAATFSLRSAEWGKAIAFVAATLALLAAAGTWAWTVNNLSGGR